MTGLEMLALGLITLLAAGLQSSAGFGFGILATPVYLMIIGDKSSIALSLLIGLFVYILLAGSKGKTKMVFPLIAGAVIFCPVGIYLHSVANITSIILVVSFMAPVSALALIRARISKEAPEAPDVEGTGHKIRSAILGATAGALGPLTAAPGVPLLWFFSKYEYSTETIVATNAVTFLIVSLFTIAFLAPTLKGALEPQVVGWLLIASGLGTIIGKKLAPKLPAKSLRTGFIALLFGTPLLLWSSIFLKAVT